MLDRDCRVVVSVNKAMMVIVFIQAMVVNAQNPFGGGLDPAGLKNWPNVDYSYARGYVYNESSMLQSKHEPVKLGALDSTVLTNGALLNKEQTELLKKVVSNSGMALLNGLSGCYIPHHAVIYYDKNGRIVAWMSVCLMCEGIRIFPNPYEDINGGYGEKVINYARKDIGKLRVMMDTLGLDGAEEGPKFHYSKAINTSIIELEDSSYHKVSRLYYKLKGGEDIMDVEKLVNKAVSDSSQINLWRRNDNRISFKNSKGDTFILDFKAGKLRCREIRNGIKNENHTKGDSSENRDCQ